MALEETRKNIPNSGLPEIVLSLGLNFLGSYIVSFQSEIIGVGQSGRSE